VRTFGAGSEERQLPVRLAASADVLIPVSLYGLALLVGLAASAVVRFPLSEGSSYYVEVARNLAGGRGLVIDAIWSYATPPLVLPRPAFELWQPLTSLIAALPMPLLGSTFETAQLALALLGALAAPLAWAVGRDAARRAGLSDRRLSGVAVGSGLIAAIFGPFVLATVAPDSTLPFLIFGTLACLLMRPAMAGKWMAGLALGLALGLAFLSRMEAIYLGVTFLALSSVAWRATGIRLGAALRVLAPVIAGGLLVTVPWLLRNLVTFGSAFPGQALDNALLTHNEQIFAYTERPNVEQFLAQGPELIAGHVARALEHGLVDVLLVPGGPLIALGLLSAVALVRREELRVSTLGALLGSGLLIYVLTSLVFPVATLWGTFRHASGPLLLGLLISAVMGADWLVARLREMRGWQRSNAWLAPFALLVFTLPLTIVQLWFASSQAYDQRERLESLHAALLALPSGPLITDRPIWISQEVGRQALVLPDEPSASVLQLARDFRAPAVLIVEQRRGYPAALRSEEAAACFVEQPLGAGAPPETALFLLREECLP